MWFDKTKPKTSSAGMGSNLNCDARRQGGLQLAMQVLAMPVTSSTRVDSTRILN